MLAGLPLSPTRLIRDRAYSSRLSAVHLRNSIAMPPATVKSWARETAPIPPCRTSATLVASTHGLLAAPLPTNETMQAAAQQRAPSHTAHGGIRHCLARPPTGLRRSRADWWRRDRQSGDEDGGGRGAHGPADRPACLLSTPALP